MSDLDQLAMLRPDVPSAPPEELVAARLALLRAIELEVLESGAGPLAAAGARLPRRFPRRLAIAAIGVVAAAGVAILLVPTLASPSRRERAANITAARLLAGAARSVENETASPPRPHQFVYSETESANGSLTETWLSADGSSEGLRRWTSGSRTPRRGGQSILGRPCSVSAAETKGCGEPVGYLPGLPADPAAVLPYLNRIGLIDTTTGPPHGAPAGWQANVIGKAVAQLMSSTYLLPSQRAALYKLMAETPGFRVVPSMKDAIGRTGVGIEWSFDGTAAVIFSPVTFDFLGGRTWPAGEPAAAGARYEGAALLRLAVVPRAGERP